MHRNGDRVLVLRDEFWYPGTVRHVEDNRYFVICDDGDDGFYQAHHLTALKLGIGDQVEVRQGEGGKGSLSIDVDYQKGRIQDLQGERVQVRIGNGPLRWIPLSRIRLAPPRRSPPELPGSSSSPSPSSSAITARPNLPGQQSHEIGDRVWACGLDLYWYPGVVLGESEDNWKVLFDFGGHALVPFGQTVPLEYEVGDRIWSRWQAGNEFFAGTIKRKNGEIIDIHYDDDDEETTSIRLARLERDDWLPPAQAYELGPGDRILGCWFDHFWYPGIILSLEGKRIHVLFDDNDQAFLTWNLIRPLEIEVGERILCRLKGGASSCRARSCARRTNAFSSSTTTARKNGPRYGWCGWRSNFISAQRKQGN